MMELVIKFEVSMRESRASRKTVMFGENSCQVVMWYEAWACSHVK